MSFLHDSEGGGIIFTFFPLLNTIQPLAFQSLL
jgi:hypothetical protein